MQDDIRRITRLEFDGELRLRLTFDDGSRRDVDLAPLVRKGGVFAPLARPENFRAARAAADGRYIEWPGGPDLCADALWLEGVPARETA